MTPTGKYIQQLLAERKRYANTFGIDESRKIYNALIQIHIRAIKHNISTRGFFII